MLNDTLANVLSAVLQDEKSGKNETLITPSSKVIKQVLEVMKGHGYIKSYEEVEDNKGNLLKIALSGNINKCGVIKPRFSASVKDFEAFEKRFLLARNMGILILSTPFGIMGHDEAKKKNTGGKLLAYCY